MDPRKIISICLIVVLVINLALFASSRITPLYFWITIIVCFGANHALNKFFKKKE